jgi:hypothetical protein
MEVPNAATFGVNLANEPPSSNPEPVIVLRIGTPSEATARVTLCSSPRRIRGASLPMIAPEGRVTRGSRVYIAFENWVEIGAAK